MGAGAAGEGADQPSTVGAKKIVTTTGDGGKGHAGHDPDDQLDGDLVALGVEVEGSGGSVCAGVKGAIDGGREKRLDNCK